MKQQFFLKNKICGTGDPGTWIPLIDWQIIQTVKLLRDHFVGSALCVLLFRARNRRKPQEGSWFVPSQHTFAILTKTQSTTQINYHWPWWYRSESFYQIDPIPANPQHTKLLNL